MTDIAAIRRDLEADEVIARAVAATRNTEVERLWLRDRERLRAALDVVETAEAVTNFAWSMASIPVPEALENANGKLKALREALSRFHSTVKR